MNCEICSRQTEILTGQTWHYTEYGSDNVYLRNIEVRSCTSCHARAPRLPRINDLHATIGRALAELPAIIEERGEPLVILVSIGQPHSYSYLSAKQLAA